LVFWEQTNKTKMSIMSFVWNLLSYLPFFSFAHVKKLDSTVKDFEAKFATSTDDTARRSAYQKTTETFYNLISDFYEWGWGQSFHFAPKYEDEDFHASIRRYEHYMASLLGIPMDKASLAKKEYQILDVGCGVGGPMRAIARFFKYRVHVTGVNITQEHIRRAARYNEKIGVKNCTLVHGDFNEIPRADGFFDAAYDFEATLHSTDRLKTFKEIYRVLKPGGRFISAQYCLLDAYDDNNAYHREVIRRVDNTNGCYIAGQTIALTTANFKKAGFNVISVEDVFEPENASDVYFHEVFEGSRGQRFTGTKFGLWCTYIFTYVGETLRFLPRGTCEVQALLMGAAESLKESGRLHIMSPGVLFVLEKPLSK